MYAVLDFLLLAQYYAVISHEAVVFSKADPPTAVLGYTVVS